MGGPNSDESSGKSSDSRPTATLLLGGDAAFGSDASPDLSPERTNVLVVSVARSVQAVVEDWREYVGALPAAFGLITYAEFDRSASASASTGRPPRQPLPGSNITLTSMADPSDLRRLGTAVTLYLDDWADTDRETLVYVDALAPFVDASGPESTFQFLHLLVQSADQLDADVVVRFDPSTADDRTVNTFRPLFDEVVDATTTAAFDADELRAVLGNNRRRFVLRVLLDTSSIELERLATRLARWENDTDEPTDAEYDRAYTALASIHVPRLAEVGLVAFDRPTERVRLADGNWSTERLERYLTTPSDDD
ncbi:DUF7504 family protein [Haloplanus aerogenes]|uniref:DUF7344 domain-containing protein n=1 Tax=Haloplanus aerogenes TaxID=660522 RepID=A0A3M0DWF7_9EURY|nr:hypothetical protein [Haloplanus aerogenes]AZH24569.1 hypothetical protein DU502_03850 [Haloplanus aerogenes]RMB23776.1 hypothetical protein ATH50_1006 [Haloplanus aerogenes]